MIIVVSGGRFGLPLLLLILVQLLLLILPVYCPCWWMWSPTVLFVFCGATLTGGRRDRDLCFFLLFFFSNWAMKMM